MNGILCVDKPEKFTSFDVVAIARKCFKTKKIGHAGTLDPMATGVLVLLINGAAKAADLLPDTDKRYRAGFRLGIVSDTQDIWGKLKPRCANGIPEGDMLEALDGFRGETEQIPPMYSAVKQNGRKLYELARKGIETERKPRKITVKSLELLNFDGTDGTLEIECSSGTYIRTLINDIGEALGTGAVMTSLRRTAACGFNLSDCHGLEEIRAADEKTLCDWLIPTEKVFSSYPAVILDGEQKKMYFNGVRLDADRLNGGAAPEEKLRVYCGEEFVGIAKINSERELVQIKRFI